MGSLHVLIWRAETAVVADSSPPCRGSAAAAGLLLLSHAADSQGSALLTYDWRENSLTVRFGVPAPGAGAGAAALRVPPPPAASSPRKAGTSRGAGGAPVDPAAAAVAAATGFAVEAQLAQLAEPLAEATAVEAAVAAEAAAANAAPRQHRRLVGGTLTAPAADAEGRVRLRVLLDGSALEVYTGSGEVRCVGGRGAVAGREKEGRSRCEGAVAGREKEGSSHCKGSSHWEARGSAHRKRRGVLVGGEARGGQLPGRESPFSGCQWLSDNAVPAPSCSGQWLKKLPLTCLHCPLPTGRC